MNPKKHAFTRVRMDEENVNGGEEDEEVVYFHDTEEDGNNANNEGEGKENDVVETSRSTRSRSSKSLVSSKATIKRQNRLFILALFMCMLLISVMYALIEEGFWNSDSRDVEGFVGQDANNEKEQDILDAKNEEMKEKGKGGAVKGKIHSTNWFAQHGRDKDHPFGHVNVGTDSASSAGDEKGEQKQKEDSSVGIPIGDDKEQNKGDDESASTPDAYDKNNQEEENQEASTEGDSSGSASTGTTERKRPQTIALKDGKRFEVLQQMQHDPTSFTQGLTYANGILYESTGLYGRSKVRKLDPQNGNVLQSIDMQSKFFGEGMTYYNTDKLIQITWKKKKGYIYNSTTLDIIEDFSFETSRNEGWGITYDASQKIFYVSDGSNLLHVWDEENLKEANNGKPSRIPVTRQNGKPAQKLNELEFWRGYILANVWYEDTILLIDPITGECVSEYDFSTLWPKSERGRFNADVLNGISVSEDDAVLFVTGKNWKWLYRVKLDWEI